MNPILKNGANWYLKMKYGNHLFRYVKVISPARHKMIPITLSLYLRSPMKITTTKSARIKKSMMNQETKLE
jgi:hypothetical protein